jgi:uncharacterized protein YyaL (SSP411 family)
VLRDDRYLAATGDLVEFIGRDLVREGDGLWRTVRDGRAATPGFAEDYLLVADGLLVAHAALGDPQPLLLARRLVDRALRDFWDDGAGTFVDTSDEHDTAITRPRGLVDNATPAANSVATDVLARLALLTGDADFDRRARSILRSVAPALDRQPSAFGRMLSAADRVLGEQLDVVVAAHSAADGRPLREAAATPYVPDLVVASVAPGDPHAGWPLFDRKAPKDGTAIAFACRGYACDEPTSAVERLAEQVAQLGSPRSVAN